MPRFLLLSLSLGGLLLGLRPHAGEGQSVPSPYRFFETKQEGGAFLGHTNQGTGRFGYGPGSGLTVGARYGLHLGGPFGIEGVFGYRPTTRDVVDPTREEGNRVVGETDAEIMSIDVRLRFSLTGDRIWHRLNPFVFAGGGLAWDLAGDGEADGLVLPQDQFEFGRRFLGLFGAGVRWIVSEDILIRGDLALTLNQLETPEGFLDPARELDRVGEKEWVSGPLFSLGIAYHF